MTTCPNCGRELVLTADGTWACGLGCFSKRREVDTSGWPDDTETPDLFAEEATG